MQANDITVGQVLCHAAQQLRSCAAVFVPPLPPTPCTYPSPQVTIYNSMGFPYVKYAGGPVEGITLRADPSLRGKPVFNRIAVRWGGAGRGRGGARTGRGGVGQGWGRAG